MTFSSRSLPLIVVPVLALALSGCTGPSQETPPPSADPSASSQPSPSHVECDDLLSPEGTAKLAADGLEPTEPQLFDAFATRMADAGAIACAWGKPDTDLVLTAVQLPVSDAEWSEWETALVEADYVDSTGTGTLYTGPAEAGSGVGPVVVATGDRITFLSTPAYAELLAQHAI